MTDAELTAALDQALQGFWDEADQRDAVAALLPVVRRAQATALREAATDLAFPSEGAAYEVWAHGGGDWLRQRALALEGLL